MSLQVVERQLRYQSLNKTTILDCSKNISLRMYPLSLLFFSCPFHMPTIVLGAVAALVSEAMTGRTQVTFLAQGIHQIGPQAKNCLHALK